MFAGQIGEKFYAYVKILFLISARNGSSLLLILLGVSVSAHDVNIKHRANAKYWVMRAKLVIFVAKIFCNSHRHINSSNGI